MLKQWRTALLVGLAAAICIFISACGDPGTGSSNTPGASNGCVDGTLVASGSTALQPLVQKVSEAYHTKCSGSNITVQGGGSKTGLSQVEAGSVQIGNSDVFADKATQGDLVDHQVAAVIFAIIVNGNVGVTNLTTDQLKGIYTGTIKNWKEVGGPDKPIVVVSRPASSGTRATFQTYVLGGPETASGPSNLTTDSTGTVVTNVAQTDGAIGYGALGSVKTNTQVKVISIDNNQPTADLVASNTYKFWNIEHMYTKGEAKDLAKAFIDYMSSDDGKSAAAALDFVPLATLQQSAISAHQPTP